MRCNFCGTFYPSEKEELLNMLEDAYNKALHKLNSTIIKDAIIGIAPHAGYVFSLTTAMLTHLTLLRQLNNEEVTIVILSPSHTGLGNGSFDSFIETPLGEIETDEELIEKLKLEKNYNAIHYEHAIEVQLPILQFLAKKFNVRIKFLPYVINHITNFETSLVEELIKFALQDKIKILISSDFVHFGYSYDFIPFTTNVDENFKRLNSEIIKKIIEFRPEEFLKQSYTVCGKYPIYLVLKVIEKNKVNLKGKLLEFTDSSKVLNHFDRVGYASIVFLKQ